MTMFWKKWSLTRKTHIAWTLFLILYVATGVVFLLLPTILVADEKRNPLEAMVMSEIDSVSPRILGAHIIVSAALNVAGFFLGSRKNGPASDLVLIIFNYATIGTMIFSLVVGVFIWFHTLRERDNFGRIFASMDSSAIQAVQDALQCCGYWNSTSPAPPVNQGFCATNAASALPCITPITKLADVMLNNFFTGIFGFEAIYMCMFLATTSLIIHRGEIDRFSRIDLKYSEKIIL